MNNSEALLVHAVPGSSTVLWLPLFLGCVGRHHLSVNGYKIHLLRIKVPIFFQWIHRLLQVLRIICKLRAPFVSLESTQSLPASNHFQVQLIELNDAAIPQYDDKHPNNFSLQKTLYLLNNGGLILRTPSPF